MVACLNRAALIETGRIAHEEEFFDGAARDPRPSLGDDLAIPDDFPGRLDSEVVEVQLEHITIVHQTEIEVNGRPVSEFDAAHFHAGQVANRGRTDVALSVTQPLAKASYKRTVTQEL